ncbi:MAG: ATP-binding protein [Actinomycetota bacterium]|nr:ATP-binding protein [Actinomycetota bacterium]
MAPVFGGSLFTPARANRRTRLRSARQAKGIRRAAQRAQADFDRARSAAERGERLRANYLPRGGESGRSALRSYRKFSVAPHRATSDVFGAAYPFLAEEGLGSEGILIGQDVWTGSSFCFDPWSLYGSGVLTNPNCVLAGVVGMGKSTLAKAMATRSIAFGRNVYVPGDPKGEWTAVSKAVGGQAIELGGCLPTRLNPLEEGLPAGTSADTQRHRLAVASRRKDLLKAIAETALGRDLYAVEATALFAAVAAAVRDNTVPVLPHVVDAMFRPSSAVEGSSISQLAAEGRQVAHALNRLVRGDLSGLFDGPSTISFNPRLPMVSLDLSRIQGSDELISLVMTCSSAWMEASLLDPRSGQRWVIYDEAWRLLTQAPLLARMQSQWKLSRALGIANLMVIHRLSDLEAVGEANSQSRNLALGLLADCSTKVIYAQESGESTRAAAALGLSSTEAAELPMLARGEGLWRVHDRAFVIRHICTPAELDLFDTDARMRAWGV